MKNEINVVIKNAEQRDALITDLQKMDFVTPLVKGKWYRKNVRGYGNFAFCFSGVYGNDGTSYGFNALGDFKESLSAYVDELETYTPLSYNEVKTLLVKEAKRRFSVGDRIGNTVNEYTATIREFEKFNFTNNTLNLSIQQIDGSSYIWTIFQNGVWAKPCIEKTYSVGQRFKKTGSTEGEYILMGWHDGESERFGLVDLRDGYAWDTAKKTEDTSTIPESEFLEYVGSSFEDDFALIE